MSLQVLSHNNKLTIYNGKENNATYLQLNRFTYKWGLLIYNKKMIIHDHLGIQTGRVDNDDCRNLC